MIYIIIYSTYKNHVYIIISLATLEKQLEFKYKLT